MISLGATEINKVCLGSDELNKVCIGSTEIWSAVPPLPYDAEVEFLQSSGTQFIDTGVNVASDLQIDIVFAIDNSFTYANTSFIFGAYEKDKCAYSVAIPSSSQIRVPVNNSFANINAAFGDKNFHA